MPVNKLLRCVDMFVVNYRRSTPYGFCPCVARSDEISVARHAGGLLPTLHVKPRRSTTGSMGPVMGTNKAAWGVTGLHVGPGRLCRHNF